MEGWNVGRVGCGISGWRLACGRMEGWKMGCLGAWEPGSLGAWVKKEPGAREPGGSGDWWQCG
jgi:hypothetical protein